MDFHLRTVWSLVLDLVVIRFWDIGIRMAWQACIIRTQEKAYDDSLGRQNGQLYSVLNIVWSMVLCP